MVGDHLVGKSERSARAAHALISDAVEALRAFGGDMDTVQAAGLLRLWRRREELDEWMIARVLSRFLPPADDDEGSPPEELGGDPELPVLRPRGDGTYVVD